jgi:lysophospholipase L1-like esterase
MSFARTAVTRQTASNRASAFERVDASNRGGSIVPASIITFGDSITLQGGGAVRWPIGTYADIGYFQYANDTLGNVFLWQRNAGLGGDTTAQMLARLSADVFAYTPDWVSVLGGINDLTGGVASATTIANLGSIYDQVLAAGCRLVACVVLPSTSINTGALQTTVDSINNFIRSYAAAHAPVILVDWWNAFRSAPGSYEPAPGYTSDGKHPSTSGASVMGGEWATALQPYKPGTTGV